MHAPPGGARFYRRSREVRVFARASVHPSTSLSPSTSRPRHPGFSFSLFSPPSLPTPLSRGCYEGVRDGAESAGSVCRNPVCTGKHAHTTLRPRRRRRNATADKDASHRLYATAPFARMLFFHRLRAIDPAARDFRPFPSRGHRRTLLPIRPPPGVLMDGTSTGLEQRPENRFHPADQSKTPRSPLPRFSFVPA